MSPIPLALSTFGLVLIVLVVVLALLVLGGVIASGRAARQAEARLQAEIAKADEELAAARAQDHGWDAAQMEAAVRAVWEHGHHAGDPIDRLHLVQVVDRPGTDADEAVYRVRTRGGHEHEVVLKRAGGRWAT